MKHVEPSAIESGCAGVPNKSGSRARVVGGQAQRNPARAHRSSCGLLGALRNFVCGWVSGTACVQLPRTRTRLALAVLVQFPVAVQHARLEGRGRGRRLKGGEARLGQEARRELLELRTRAAAGAGVGGGERGGTTGAAMGRSGRGRTSRDECSGEGSARLAATSRASPGDALLASLLAGGRWRHDARVTRRSALAASSAT